MIIGITGIFGSGKTIVARLFTKHGYKHINADEIGHKLLNKTRKIKDFPTSKSQDFEEPIKNRIIKAFGRQVLTKNKIDRRKLKNIVFYNHKELIKLNRIIHPSIIGEIELIIKKDKKKKIIVDGALIIEAKCLNLFDKLIVVKINKKEQLRRILKKGKYNSREINNIIKSQLSQKEKLKYADIVIDNSKSLDNTKKQVNKIVERLI